MPDWGAGEPVAGDSGISGSMFTGTKPGSSSCPTSWPERARRRQLNNWLVESPCRRAVADTNRRPLKLSATIRCFSSNVHRRRDPVSITSSVETCDIGV